MATSQHLRNHASSPQLRLPRQSATRFAATALFWLTQEFSRELHFDNSDCSRPASLLPLELPGLRRNHACRRTAHRSSTSASLPASLRVHRMNAQPQPRPSLAPWREQRLCVSLSADCFADPHLHLYRPPPRDSSLDPLSLQLPRTAANSNFPNHRDLLIHIQNT